MRFIAPGTSFRAPKGAALPPFSLMEDFRGKDFACDPSENMSPALGHKRVQFSELKLFEMEKPLESNNQASMLSRTQEGVRESTTPIEAGEADLANADIKLEENRTPASMRRNIEKKESI